ncbi:MAG: tRNA(Met) cytidine acetyltransferase, partial [Pseudomonadales bacterium]|nr:tRNA(Met) cytidine acetyltransferase [Pseudomonadales bacterium]
VRKLVPADFLADEALLQRVFALLVEAHYQTQPNDLRLLLDALYAHIWVAIEYSGAAQSAHVVAVLLALEEGGLDDAALLSAIVAGKRRPRGNLLAQRMANFSGEANWCRERSIRITRIAVAKNWRRRHVASHLLADMKLWATAKGYSYWSSSFGFRSELLGFWQSAAAMPVYLGMHLDKSSGARNLMVAAPLRPGAIQQLIASAASDLYAYLDYWYPRFLVELDALDKRALQHWSAGQQHAGPAGSVWALKRVQRFVAREIEVAAVLPALAVLQRAAPAFGMLDASAAPPGWLPQLQNIIAKAPAWSILARELELAGQAAVVAKLRELCAVLQPPTSKPAQRE